MDADERKIADAIARIPGAKRALAEYVDRIRAAHAGYRKLHWGDGGRDGVKHATVPDVSGGVVVLGRLVEVAYLTRKDEVAIYEHSFRAPYPVLCVAPDGSREGLVVVRDRSRYTVTRHGIEG